MKNKIFLYLYKSIYRISESSNEEQGKNGTFFGYATSEIRTVRAILVGQEIEYNSETIDDSYL